MTVHSEMLDTLSKKVDPRHAALIVVDFQNEFVAPGGAMDREGFDLSMVRSIIPDLQMLLKQARESQVPIIFIRNVYSTDANWYLSGAFLEQAKRARNGSYVIRPVCSPDSWAGEFCEVSPSSEDAIVTKHRFSAFQDTDLDLILRSRNIRTLIMTGVASNVCVESTARDGFFRDYYIVFTEDCSATYFKEDHESTLRNISRFFGEVVTARKIIECW